ncbi:MAG: cobaltochelatase subunit CobN [Paracoccaceae bacterium]|nr:cobaltochelatase subunit CobN [Paracoccaceae bacterium]
MHLLQARPGRIDDDREAVDLGQTPADLLFLSAADTELAALAAARDELGAAAGSLRLASLAHLRHPFSIDRHISDCALGCRLVIARILGGRDYWPYGAEQYAARLGEAGIPFAALPGDDKPDDDLRRISTIGDDDWENLWAYLVEGGSENTRNFLLYARSLLANGERPPLARPLLRAGVYWPGSGVTDLDRLRANWIDGAPVVPLIFYRALVQGAGLHPINRLVRALVRRRLNPLPLFVVSLRDEVSAATLDSVFRRAPPSVILNGTAFAAGSPDPEAAAGMTNPLIRESAAMAPVLQLVFCGASEEAWRESAAGLGPRDIAMHVALPEVDGRVLTRAVSFKDEAYFDTATECPIATYRARGDRVAFVAELAEAWTRLRRIAAADRRIGIVVANYPNRDGRIANGVGLDTPASADHVIRLLKAEGYRVDEEPRSGSALMECLLAGPTNAAESEESRPGGVHLPLAAYLKRYADLPWEVRDRIESRWGQPDEDPSFVQGGFRLPIHLFGNLAVGIQPARGYNIDPKETYHSPDLPPPHNYLAFYFWLRQVFDCHAVIHLGKHGNLEWLPGKALALSPACFPEAVLGPVPHVYPFIVNDPGEGSQAKRRTSAVIVDHLTPPLTRAETYGPLRDLEALLDEYYDAVGMDPQRLDHLRREIVSLTSATGLDRDAGLDGGDLDSDLARLDAWLCDIKEAQIRDGLHVFGQSPEGRLERDLLQALVRVPRGYGSGGEASLQQALAEDLGLGLDPLDCAMAVPWTGPRPAALSRQSGDIWRSQGDTVERIEGLAAELLEGASEPPGPRSRAVMAAVETRVRPSVRASGPGEDAGLIAALSGRFVPPSPSGAPTRGRLDVLPTGRNFFSVDSRSVPTPAAWALGWKSASLLIERHLQDHGDWPRAMLLSAWGTANMRTGGADVAQALALMGVRPTWSEANRRVTGFEILPLSVLDRPRIDVTLRISGFFRDAFPQQVELIDAAARAVMALDEPETENPAAASRRTDAEDPGFRVFGSKPGAYGAGLQAMIDERLWSDRADLGEAWLEWGHYAYGQGVEGESARPALEARLQTVEAVIQNQDNREHDLLDSDDYYQFEGGAAAAVASLQGRDRPVYHNDLSRPERPVIRTLDEEISRVVRSRVVNPKWIEGVMRHGYKGAFEIAASVDYLFAFAATTGAVQPHHFDLVHDACLEDGRVRDFIDRHNPPALREIAERLQEAIDRNLWIPRSNSARARLETLLAQPE